MPEPLPPRRPAPTGRSVRVVAVAAVVAALTVVVALASRSRPGDGERRELELPDVELDWLLWVGLGLMAVIVVAMVAAAAGGPGRRRPPPRLSLVRVIAFAVVLLTLALIAPRFEGVLENLRQSAEAPPAGEQGERADDEPATPPAGGASPAVLALVALGAVGAALVVVALRRRRPDDEAAAATMSDTLDEALAEGIDDLRSAPDPRAAVIAAYARMERALGAAGFRRATPETTREYVERVLGGGGPAPGAVRDLGRLYERARYDRTPVPPTMRDEAVAALVAVREELRGVPA